VTSRILSRVLTSRRWVVGCYIPPYPSSDLRFPIVEMSPMCEGKVGSIALDSPFFCAFFQSWLKLANSLAAAPKTWCSKSASARFTSVVIREYRSNRELFNLIKFYECLEESIVEKLIFLTVENNNNKKRLGIIGSSWWQTLHKPNPKPRTLCWTYFLKTSFS